MVEDTSSADDVMNDVDATPNRQSPSREGGTTGENNRPKRGSRWRKRSAPCAVGRCAPDQHEALISRPAGKANGSQKFSWSVPMVITCLRIAVPLEEVF